MRLAIVSDIHGNLTALEAVVADMQRRGVDRVGQGGDLALGGCHPAEVIDLVRELDWTGIVGNTDELLWRPEQRAVQEHEAPGLVDLVRVLFDHWGPATRELIGEERVEWLRRLPDEHREDDLVLLHASPGNLWRAPAPDAEEGELLATYEPCEAQTVVYGHIHRPYIRRMSTMTVANSGSVGSPFDGDPRASYLIWEAGKLEIVRVEYAVEREVSRLLSSRYPDARRIAETRRRGRFVPVGTI
ncbi:MAG: metallophosphoesterase family protein [Solirubrobacteraceae bacterium]